MKKIFTNYNFLRFAVLALVLAAVMPQALINRSNAATCSISIFASPNMISSGQSSTIVYNSTDCSFLQMTESGQNQISGQGLAVPNGSFDSGALTSDTTFTISGDGGASNSATVTVAPAGTSCQINTFTSSPPTITAGGTSTLSWTSSNCSGLNLTGGGLNTTVAGNGSMSVSPSSTSTYTLSSIGSLSTTVSVVPPSSCAINSFTANPNPVNYLDRTSSLSWTTSNCTVASLSVAGAQPISVATSGGYNASNVNNGDTYILYAGTAGNPQAVSSSITLTVNTNCVITALSYSPFSSGQSTTISYTTQFCTTVQLNGGQFNNTPLTGSGFGSASGSITTNALNQPTTYTLSASGGNVANSQSITATPSGPTCTVNVSINPINNNQITATASVTWHLQGPTSTSGSGETSLPSMQLGNYTLTADAASVNYQSVNWAAVSGSNSGSCATGGATLSLLLPVTTIPVLHLGP